MIIHDKEKLFLPLPPGFAASRLKLRQGEVRLIHGGKGPAMFLIHGLGGSSEDFFLMAPLLARERSLFIPDLPGFGDSAKPDAPYTMDWYLKVLREMAAVLGLARADWLGHSMGGLLVLLLALRQPDLVEKAVAVCPAGGHAKLPWRLWSLKTFLLDQENRLRIRALQLMLLHIPLVLFHEWSPLARDFSRRFIAHWRGPQGLLLERATVRAGLSIMATPIWRELDRLRRPALLITGRHDWVVTAKQTKRLAGQLPQHSKIITLSCGHMAPYSRAGQVARAALDFCRRSR
ncbi:hypothetical protein AAU61_19900 [Desulfocarbo indianensis]|nr:hypothetical protein AAU61_19900 [Desulfocarbo indianensis]